jgi:signal transduction histidine kinase
VQILRDDLGIAQSAGAHLAEIVDSGSASKARNMIAALAERGQIAGWELNVPDGDAARTLSFAGSAPGESLLIFAAPNLDSIAELFDDVASANVETTRALRTLLHEQRAGISAALNRDHRLYDELSRLNNELINRERELARKSAALERMSAEKNRIVGIAAHDLRNPLTIITAYADLLISDGAVSGENLESVAEIARSARFMTELVEELLDSSRLESGQIDMDLQDLDLVVAARHAATVNRFRAEQKEITITFEEHVDRVFIRADPVKLRQIINNLVVNAIKFSPPRTNVRVRVLQRPGRAIVEVEDQGIGIPQDKLSLIFEPFRTLGSSGTAGETSTGLGLAIVKQLVHLHGATIEVESEEKRGSLFRVSFPVA